MIYGDDLCESLAALMVAELQDGNPDNVVVRWGFSLRADEKFTGQRYVDLFPDPESPVQAGVKIRGGDGFDHAVLVVVWENCPPEHRNKSDEPIGEPGKPNREWMRERLRWSLRNVFRRYSDERDRFRLNAKDLDTGEEVELYPSEASVVQQYDPAAEERGSFVAQYRLVFREQE
jgi:hypothetical protein